MALYDEPQKTGNRLLGQNLVLQFDPNTSNWKYQYQPFNYTSMPTMPTFKTEPEFPTAPVTDTTPETPTTDPCPPGYIYDAEKKMCVVDPNYVPPAFEGEGAGQPTSEAPKPDLNAQSREAVESFIELKNEGNFDFNTYNADTRTVDYKPEDDFANTAIGVIAGAIHPILGIPFAIPKIDKFTDEQALKNRGILKEVEDPANPGQMKMVADLQQLNRVSEVDIRGVPASAYAQTHGSLVGDPEEAYKKYAEQLTVDEMPMLGAADTTAFNFPDVSFEGIAGQFYSGGQRVDPALVQEAITRGYTTTAQIQNYVDNKIQQQQREAEEAAQAAAEAETVVEPTIEEEITPEEFALPDVMTPEREQLLDELDTLLQQREDINKQKLDIQRKKEDAELIAQQAAEKEAERLRQLDIQRKQEEAQRLADEKAKQEAEQEAERQRQLDIQRKKEDAERAAAAERAKKEAEAKAAAEKAAKDASRYREQRVINEPSNRRSQARERQRVSGRGGSSYGGGIRTGGGRIVGGI